MHKNIKTVAGCFTNVTCNVTATDGREVELTAYIAIGQERRPVSKRGTNVFAFPAVEYGQHLYEIRADGKPLIFGFLLVRPSAFPVAEGTVDYTLNATLSSIDALHIDIVLTPGPRGYSAYDIAAMEGFEGSEAEWLEHMRQQTATLAVEQVSPLMKRAETAADKSEREAAAAKTEQETAAAHAKAAKESSLAADEHKTASAAEVDKAKLEREAAAGHATAAAKSAQDAETAKAGAEQAARDAQTAKSGAEQAAANAAASKTAAQTAEGNAKASANAAAVDKAAAEKAKTDAQAAQTKAEQAADTAEQNAALLGDAALKGEDNVFAGKQTLNGDVVLNGMLSGAMLAKINYLQHKYDTCKTAAEMKAIDPNYNADLNTGVITCLPSYEGDSFLGVMKVNLPYMPALKKIFRICYYQGEELHFYNPMGDINDAHDTGAFLQNNYVTRYMKRMYAVLPNAVSLSTLCSNETKLEEFHCEELPKCVTTSFMWTAMFWRTALREFHTRMPALKFGGGSAYGMFQECKQLRVCSVSFPALVVGVRMFDGTILDAASACTVLDGLQVAGEPDWSGWKNQAYKTPWVLTIGIHIDHQNDETVLAAIANAEAKGWTLTVQWNPGGPTYTTPEASTMAMGTLIYARVDEHELPDGTTERVLDWGHYVTNWEARGYEQFRSLESAYRYFNLPEPEETLTNE